LIILDLSLDPCEKPRVSNPPFYVLSGSERLFKSLLLRKTKEGPLGLLLFYRKDGFATSTPPGKEREAFFRKLDAVKFFARRSNLE